jgi:hypothetical protein
VKVPKNHTAPRSKIYTARLGVEESYVGYSREITNGVYILDKEGCYTDWQSWDTTGNDNAIGVGYNSSALAVTFAKNFAKIRSYAGSVVDVLSKFISIVEPTLQMSGKEGPIVDAKNLIEELKVLQDKNISVEEIYHALTDGAQGNQQQASTEELEGPDANYGA